VTHLIFLGTYTRTGPSQGIYAVRLDGESGALSAPSLAAAASDPGWIELSPDRRFLYAVHPSRGQAIAYRVDGPNAALVAVPAPDPGPRATAPSHLAVDATGRTVLAANYHEGCVVAIPAGADGSLGTPQRIVHEGRSVHPTRQDKSHVHSVTLSPDNRFVLVADLGLDRIYTYAFDYATGRFAPGVSRFVATAPGAGPRHLKFSADGQHVFAINELDNTIVAYAYEAASGTLIPRQSVSTLPAGFNAPSISAEIRVHPNGRFLYGSNRGHDSLAVMGIAPVSGALSPVEIVPSGGRTPRNFALSPDGRWLVCGHQDTPLLTVFRVDADTGRLTQTTHTAEVPTCICVLFFD
jgi:6-phosphogluconolactonase